MIIVLHFSGSFLKGLRLCHCKLKISGFWTSVLTHHLCVFVSPSLSLPPGLIGHQPHDQAGLSKQEAGLHHGGRCDHVISVRLPQQEIVSGERQQSRCAAEASAGGRVWAAESLKETFPLTKQTWTFQKNFPWCLFITDVTFWLEAAWLVPYFIQ